MPSLGDLIVRVGADVEQFKSAMGAVNSQLRTLDKQIASSTDGFDRFSSRLQDIGGKLMGIGAGLTAALTVPLGGVAAASLKVAADMEQATIAFSNFLGGAEKAKAFMGELRDFAMKTPFEMPGLISAAQRLMAMGFAAEKTLPMLRNIGDAVAGVGGSAETLNRVVTAFGQIQAKGTLAAEEMRQLAEAGIPAWKMLADALKVDVSQAMKMVESRAVSAEVAIDALTKGIEKSYGGLMQMQSRTLAGMWSNFKDQITKTFDSIGQSLLPLAKQMLDMGSGLLSWVEGLAAGFAKLPHPIQLAIVGFGALLAAVGPLTMAFGALTSSAGALVGAWVKISPMFGAMGTAAGALSTALIGIAPLLGAIGIAAAAIDLSKTAAEFWEVTGVAPKVRDAFDAIRQAIVDLAGKVADALGPVGAALRDFFRGIAPDADDAIAALKSRFSNLKWRDLIMPASAIDEAKRGIEQLGDAIADKTVLIADKIKVNLAKTAQTTSDLIAKQAKAAGDAMYKSLDTLAGAFDKLKIKSGDEIKKQATELRQAYEKVAEGFKKGTVTSGELNRAHNALAKGLEDLYGKAEKTADTFKKLDIRLLDEKAKLGASARAVDEARAKYNEWLGNFDNYVADTLAFSAALDKMGASVLNVSRLPAPSFADDATAAFRRYKEALDSLGNESSESLRARVDETRAYWERLASMAGEGSHNVLVAERNYLRALRDEAKANGLAMNADEAARLAQLEGMTGAHIEKQKKSWFDLGQQISTIMTDLSKGIADAIFAGGKFGERMLSVIEEIGKSIVRTLIEGALKQLSDKILEVSGLFSKMMGGTAAGAAGGAASSAAGSAAGGAGSSASNAAGSAVAGSLSGWITAGASAISAITDILGYFQGRRMEQDIGRIEVTSREIKAELMNFRRDAWDRETHLMVKLDDLWHDIQVIAHTRGGGEGATGEDPLLVVLRDQTNPLISGIFDALKGMTFGGLDALVGVIRNETNVILQTTLDWGKALGVSLGAQLDKLALGTDGIIARFDLALTKLDQMAKNPGTVSPVAMSMGKGNITQYTFSNCTFSGVTEDLVKEVFSKGTRELVGAGAL